MNKLMTKSCFFVFFYCYKINILLMRTSAYPLLHTTLSFWQKKFQISQPPLNKGEFRRHQEIPWSVYLFINPLKKQNIFIFYKYSKSDRTANTLPETSSWKMFVPLYDVCFSAIEAKLFKSQGRIGTAKSRQTM